MSARLSSDFLCETVTGVPQRYDACVRDLGVEIRSAISTDADRIHEVSVASCRAAYEPILSDHTFLDAVDDPARVAPLRQRLASDGSFVYLVAETESVIGYCHAPYGDDTPDRLDDGVAYLRSLYVHPDRWYDGVGTQLLQATLARLPTETSVVRLDVLADNERAVRFYESRGFERVGAGTFEIADASYETSVYERSL